MNQDNNYNVAPVGDNTGIPEVPSVPIPETVNQQVVTPQVVDGVENVAPVGNNIGVPEVPSIPETPVAPVQEVVSQPVVTPEVQSSENVAPVGDNTAIPEVPGAPEAPSVEDTTQNQNTNTSESTTAVQNNNSAPHVVKPNAYNVEAVVITEEEQLINGYIGKNHQKIVHKRFNWAAFFFGGFYYFYRKIRI